MLDHRQLERQFGLGGPEVVRIRVSDPVVRDSRASSSCDLVITAVSQSSGTRVLNGVCGVRYSFATSTSPLARDASRWSDGGDAGAVRADAAGSGARATKVMSRRTSARGMAIRSST